MRNIRSTRPLILPLAFAALLLMAGGAKAQGNQVMGELKFSSATRADRNSGVWIDGQYLGYVKELKENKKVMLLPGQHEISVRQAGYADFTETIVVEPGHTYELPVRMAKDPRAIYPGSDAAELELDIEPGRAAVFVDNGYVGHASRFAGLKSMLVTPGKHRVKFTLPGYRTFETEVNLLPGQKAEVETNLVPGSIQQADSLIKP